MIKARFPSDRRLARLARLVPHDLKDKFYADESSI